MTATEAPGVEEEHETVFTDQDGRVTVSQQRLVQPSPAAIPPPGAGTSEPPAASSAGITPGGAVASAWVLGVVAMLGASGLARVRLRRLLRVSRLADAGVTSVYGRVAGTGRRPPPLRVTSELESPALAGTLRPVILLPEWITARAHRERLEWALRHELSHWRSRDHLRALAAELSRALFFFHPVVWWVARRWREAMEMACDESVIDGRRDVRRYAEELYRMLAHVDQRRRTALSPSLFATRTQIGRRIESLLRSRHRATRPGAAATAAVGVFALASFATGADFAPRPPHPPEAPAVVVAETDGLVAGAVAHYDNVSVFEINDDREIRLRGEGVEFERGSGRVLGFDDGGFLRVWETRDGTERRVRVTPGADGGFRYHYRVNDRPADWDDDAQRWLADILRTHLSRVRNHANRVEAPGAPIVPSAMSPAIVPGVEVAPTPTVAPTPPVLVPRAAPLLFPVPPATPAPKAPIVEPEPRRKAKKRDE
jgi:beta-lactamase regulating signal transducer with metallopeptidase domain